LVEPPLVGFGTNQKLRATTWDGPECRPAKRKGGKDYAVTASVDGADRGGSAAVVGEQFHTDGGVNQINFERGGGDCDGFVAAEHFWTVSFAVADAGGDLNIPDRAD
jgi:hypothetical protein